MSDITGLAEGKLGFLRKQLQVVFQDPMGSLDPRMSIRQIIAEPLQVQRRSDIDERVATVLGPGRAGSGRGRPVSAPVLRRPAAADLHRQGDRP